MPFTVSLTIPTERFAKIRGALTDTKGPLEEVGHYIKDKWMVQLFKSAGQGTWPPVLRGGSPLWDKGTLANAFSWSLGTDRKSVLVTNPMKYAAIQHFGGTVTPKSGKFLAIPLPTLSKTDRRKSPREFPNTFFAKSRNGNLILFEKTDQPRRNVKGKHVPASESGIRPLFVMKSSVTIKPRPFMKWFPAMADEAKRIASEAIIAAMRGAA